jgi:hypothetical protein
MQVDGTGVGTVKNDALSIYPNPASDKIFINTTGQINNTVFAADGRKLIETDKKEIDIKSLPAGIYIIKIADSKGNIIKTDNFRKVN